MNAVTRTEIAECLEGAFVGAPMSVADVRRYAGGRGARAEVLDVLDRLHHSSYRELRDLWGELADVPVEP